PVVVALMACLPLAAFAGIKGGADKPRAGAGSTLSAPAQARPKATGFVEANLLETFYHELGHALIDVMQLDVYGPEEYAADFFAAYMLDHMYPPDQTRNLVHQVTAAYRLDSGGGAEGGSGALWDLHARPMQRYYNLACLYYGAAPETREDALSDLGLPEARAETCADEYANTALAWGHVLEQLGEQAPGQSLTLDWVLDAQSPAARFISAQVDRLNQIMALPEPVTVSVIPCGAVNAFYDPGEHEILICTEWADHLAKIAP
ncbi:MAG TPA: hypothetical protein ENK83_04355, partial [Aliiroseovarius sp.]|nr:hypothetical protein [Aliiroseovarius sp.]